MHSAILFGAGVLAGVCLLGLYCLVRDLPRAERDARRIEALEADARAYARAWATIAKRGKVRGALRTRLAQMGGTPAA